MSRLNSGETSVAGFKFKRLGFDAFDLYAHYFRNATHEDLTYYGSFPLMMYKRFGYKVIDGYLFVFRYLRRSSGDRIDSVGLPINEKGERLDVETTRKCLESFNGQPRGKIIHLHPGLDARYPNALQSREATALGSEYIYSNELVAKLDGGTFRSLRRMVHRFTRNNDFEVVPYEKKLRADVDQIYENWRQSAGAKYDMIWDRTLFTNILDHHGIMDHHLNIVIDKSSGKSIGLFDAVRLSPGLAIAVFQKLDTNYAHMAQYCGWHLSQQLSAMGCAFLNVGDDGGRDGLKALKTSFRPVSSYTPLFYKF